MNEKKKYKIMTHKMISIERKNEMDRKFNNPYSFEWPEEEDGD